MGRSALGGLVVCATMLVGIRPSSADLPTPRLLPELTPKDKGAESGPSADPWTSRPRQVSLVGGAPGSPTGVVGLSFEYAPIKYLVLGGGAGWAPDGGPRVAFMPRFRLPVSRWFAFGLGTPLAAGPYYFTSTQPERCDYVGCDVGYRTTRNWAVAVWGHLEPNVEIRVSSAIALRIYAGYGRVLNHKSDRCVSTLPNGCPSSLGEDRWYGGLALGYAW